MTSPLIVTFCALFLLAVLWLNRPRRVRAQRDQWWIRETARRDYATSLLLAKHPEFRTVDAFFLEPEMQAAYDVELDRLRDGPQ